MEEMDAAGNVTSCGPSTTSERLHERLQTSINSFSSSDHESDGNVLDEESDDTFGVDALPIDRESLEHELARLTELERSLQSETATDFKLGCAVLIATRQKRLDEAQAALERRREAARKVLAYANDKARESYTNRCAELQREMRFDMERELQRLQIAKDGVSVTSRRRRAVRDETRGNFSTPVNSAGNGMRRRRTMYASDGDEDGPEDVFIASASPHERAQRIQFQEKKRLEQLLGRASVFTPVVKELTASEIAEDLKTIQIAVLCRDERSKSSVPQSDTTKQQQRTQQLQKKTNEKKSNRGRRTIITPRRIPHASGPNGAAHTTPSQRMVSTTRKDRVPRLCYNPRMLQEGQEVKVLKRNKTETSGRDARSQEECVMSGIITAATANQVYILTASGRFESFDVRDCILGSLYVRAADSPTKSVRKTRRALK